ncbi:MAG TPA: choice-of-anchor D domain-containing protein [Acidobacteriaceae bacterium]|nr:choice-of-anchor D domain-containing protein [Acidobacteriaceae bacterium]
MLQRRLTQDLRAALSLLAVTALLAAQPPARAQSGAESAAPAFAPDALSGASAVWQPVGPGQIATGSWNLVTGPVTSVAADPSDSSGNTVYLGSAGGGLWKSTNAAGSASAVSFSPLTDTLSVWPAGSLTSISIGAVSVQPGGTGVVLAGTGDPNNDANSWYGNGLLRSTDGGNTWAVIQTAGNSFSGAGLIYSFAGSGFAGFAWSTAHPNVVVAAVADSAWGELRGLTRSLSVAGLYYSSDAGNTWQLATLEDGAQVFESPLITQSGGNTATAVVWNPIRQRFYAAIQYHGYYESLDGITWTRLASQPGLNFTATQCPANPMLPGSQACPLFRGALAVQPATGDLFALSVDQNNRDQGLWRDVCSLASGACGSSTVQFTSLADQALQSSPGILSQADEDLWLAAVPSQQDTLLLVGATDIWRCSLANSCAWRNTTNTQTCAAAKVAPAQQAVDTTFAAKGLLYFGNEGGLWRTTDAVAQQSSPCSSDDPAHFQNLNGGLGSLGQVESFSQDPGNPSTWLAAMGDLGTAAPNSGVWSQVLSGQGDVVAIDPANPQNWYAASSLSPLGISRCTAGSSCAAAAFSSVIGEAQVGNDEQTIPAPWILDPLDSTSLLLGTCRVWRGPATGNWTQTNLLSPMLDGDQDAFCNGNAEIRSLAAAANAAAGASSEAEQIYAGMAGAFDGGGLVPGHLFTAAFTPASPSAPAWTDQYASPVVNGLSKGLQFNPSGFDVSSIVPDPHDATGQTIYATIQGVSAAPASQPLVYRSTDAGAHWSDVSANLPSAPANSLAVDPNNAGIVYVALDTGVYYTEDITACTVIGAQCWNLYGSGLPNAPVTSLMTFNQDGTQELRAATRGRGIWQAPLDTAGSLPTTAVLNPDALIFAPQQAQTASPAQTIVLSNTGSVPLDVSSLGITGDFSETDNCTSAAIAVGASCPIQIVFAPLQAGALTGTLTVEANVAGGQLTATFQGTALTPVAILLTPSSLAFGGIPLGSSSAPQFVTIANTGGAAAALSAETVSGDFGLSTNTCGASLQPNSSCTAGIVFTPTASGTRQGQFSVTDSAGTQTAPLSGTGQSAPTDSLSPLSLSFAAQQVGTTSAAQTVALSNSGDQPLTNIAFSMAGDFTMVDNCGSVLQGHGSCALAIAYVPSVIGPEPGVLTVRDALGTQTVTLSGTGLAPPGASATPTSINFGGLAVGTTSTSATVTVTNSGGFALTNLAASITTGFAIASNNCPATLGLGAACQIGVTFSPSAASAATGTLTVSAANLTAPLSVALSGSGSDFSLVVNGSSSAIITSGQTATFAVQFAGLAGSTGTVALTCSGAPQYAQCSLNPASVALNGLNSAGVTVSLATGLATSSALRRNAWQTTLPLALPAFLFTAPLFFFGLRRRRSAWLLMMLAAVTLTLGGCSVGSSSGSGSGGSGGGGGGGGTPQNQTPSGTYPLTITATMANITHTAQVTVTVQ